MSININYSDGILNKGNNYRLKKIMAEAENGGSFTIGFIGGSITQGSVASKPTLCYAYRVFEWWQKTFPNAEFKYVNAGIGATDSQFGCARVNDDLLSYNPDFVITEFSVNDENNGHFLETYEGLIRKIYSHGSKPALVTMNNICYDTGNNAEDRHVMLAKYYGFPSVGIRNTIYRAVLSGEVKAELITPDNLHPNDLGHELVAEQIICFLEKILSEKDIVERDIVLNKVLTANSYEQSERLNNTNFSPVLDGFTADTEKQQGLWDCFKNGWVAGQKNAKIEFDVTGCNIAVMYRKSCKHPAPVARLTLDGDTDNGFILDANFAETWGDKLFLFTVAEHIANTSHHVEIEVIKTHDDDTAPFYLAALLVSH